MKSESADLYWTDRQSTVLVDTAIDKGRIRTDNKIAWYWKNESLILLDASLNKNPVAHYDDIFNFSNNSSFNSADGIVLNNKFYYTDSRSFSSTDIDYLRWTDLDTLEKGFKQLRGDGSLFVFELTLTPYNDQLYFVQYFPDFGTEIAAFNPLENSIKVLDFYPGGGSLNGMKPTNLFVHDDKLYYETFSIGPALGENSYFYYTDGESQYPAIAPHSGPIDNLIARDDSLFYLINDQIMLTKNNKHSVIIEDASTIKSFVAENHTIIASGSIEKNGTLYGQELIKYEYNHPSEISLAIDNSELSAAQQSVITLTANDFDEDELTIQWEQTEGPVKLAWEETSNGITFTTPELQQKETFSVRVTVSDGFDSQHQSISFTVEAAPVQNAQPTPPISHDTSKSGGTLGLLSFLIFLMHIYQRKFQTRF